MTSSEMILRVRQSSRQIDSFVRGALLVEEILLQLNIAQDQYQFIKYKKGKSDRKELVDIRTSESKETISSSTKLTEIINASEFIFPEDFRFINTVYVVDSENQFRRVEVIPEEDCGNFIKTKSNIPIIRVYKAFVSNERLVILHDPFDQSPTQIELNYYKKLPEITSSDDCILPEHTHDAICEIAVNRIVGRTNPQEYQISSDILNKTE